MLKTKEVIGLPVLNLNDGNQIGKIKDIYFDGLNKKVVYLEISEKTGLFKKTESFLSLEKIHSIGKNAVTVEKLDFSTEIPKELGEFKYSNLIGRNVIYENGSILGKVTEVNFNFPEGKILSFGVSGGDKALVDMDKIRVIGKDAIIVYNQ